MTLVRIQVRRDNTTGWASANPVLAAGEPGFDTVLKQLRIGDGATPWSGLLAATPDAATLARIIETADAIEGATGANDAVMTAVAGDPGSAFSSQLSATFAAVVSVAQFVQAGESLNADNTGNGNNSAIFQRAVNALNTAYLADGRPRQIYVPEGVFRLSAQIEWKSGVGVRGAGRGKTAFRPQANQAAFNHEPSGLTWLDDCQFEDFTINGADQTSTATDSYPKGFRLLFARRLYVARVNVVNTWATGFGFDGCDGLITDCFADNCGRCHPRDANGMAAGNGFGSGFGIGVGAREYEPFVMTNCVANNCGTNGFGT